MATNPCDIQCDARGGCIVEIVWLQNRTCGIAILEVNVGGVLRACFGSRQNGFV